MENEITRTGIVTTCIVCGESFLSASGKKLYCSSRCWYRRNRDRHVPRITKTCPVCGKTFAGTRRKTFCSDRCYLASTRTARVAYSNLYHAAVMERLETDCEAYAEYRARQRLSHRKSYEWHHPGCKPYRQTESRRIPDWAVKGQEIIDRRSAFLPGNMSDEKVMAAEAYARELRPDAGANRPRVKTIFRSR